MSMLLLAFSALASACDAKPLVAAFAEVSPAAAGDEFVKIAACDAAAAKALAPEAFKRIIAGPGGQAAAVQAVKLGAGPEVLAWIGRMQPDERGSTLAQLGDSCATPEVGPFFVASAATLAERFYSERWWAGLDGCRVPEVQALLGSAVTAKRKDRTLFAALLDVYARNLGGSAVPMLTDLLKSETDTMVLIDIIDAFPAAAGVGDAAGMNAEAAKAASAALRELAPGLPEKTADQSRKALLSLGDELAADKLSVTRYRPVAQPDGGLLYGVVGVEVATCKKGDTRVEIHQAQVKDTGHTWPDQLAERVEPKARDLFALELAANCKGTSAISFRYTEVPIKDAAAYGTWLDTQLKEIQSANPGVNAKVYPYEPMSL